MAYTSPIIPEPMGCHAEPFQTAMFLAGLPPACEKFPPAYTLDSSPCSANTEPEIPVPAACHVVPSQRATLLALTPPAVVNCPPAHRSSPAIASAWIPPRGPVIPLPRGNHS